MKVLHFYKVSYPESMGGIEQVIHHIASGGVRYGVQCDVLSLTNAKQPNSQALDGYQIHRVPVDFQVASSGFSFAALTEFKRLAAKADIIHYHFPWPLWILCIFWPV